MDEAKMLKDNERMIFDIAKRYVGTTIMDMDDLMQEGRIGFLQGMRMYEPDRGTKLTTYCWFHTRKAIVHAVRGMTDAGISRREYEDTVALQELDARLYQDLRHPPTDEELAEVMGVSTKRVRYIKRLSADTGDMLSLDEPLDTGSDDDVMDLHDLVPSTTNLEEDYMSKELAQQVMEAVRKLVPEYQEIMELRFFDNLTFQEIADATGLSSRTVRRRYDEALEALGVAIA